MEQNLNAETELDNQQQLQQPDEAKSAINFATIFTAVVLNWKWFVLSIVICLGLAAVYLRYATPIYQVSAKLLIKDNDQNSPNSANKNAMLNSATLGLISNSNGFDNEMEILTSHSLALQVVKDMKIYVDYYFVGKVKDELLYRQQTGFHCFIHSCPLFGVSRRSLAAQISGTPYFTGSNARRTSSPSDLVTRRRSNHGCSMEDVARSARYGADRIDGKDTGSPSRFTDSAPMSSRVCVRTSRRVSRFRTACI